MEISWIIFYVFLVRIRSMVMCSARKKWWLVWRCFTRYCVIGRWLNWDVSIGFPRLWNELLRKIRSTAVLNCFVFNFVRFHTHKLKSEEMFSTWLNSFCICECRFIFLDVYISFFCVHVIQSEKSTLHSHNFCLHSTFFLFFHSIFQTETEMAFVLRLLLRFADKRFNCR